jgi:hypothetical protein
MEETWYVVPAATVLEHSGASEKEAEDQPLMLFVHPDAGSVWPRARVLPRRVTGSEKK